MDTHSEIIPPERGKEVRKQMGFNFQSVSGRYCNFSLPLPYSHLKPLTLSFFLSLFLSLSLSLTGSLRSDGRGKIKYEYANASGSGK